ncbi:hypothetical protein [Actinomadura litoris]|uniref:Uncharacterized protein n=1 Tax=Actinomadura litoris TaxID=2678616 RepID=A0A7K1L9X2_9ACTN|nr:hypothetical protein [Actinomadura litoris]MUN41220.1 hypothetical protein [Actinomadura litoris]
MQAKSVAFDVFGDYAREPEAERVLATEPSARYDLFRAAGAERAARCWKLDEIGDDYRMFVLRGPDLLPADRPAQHTHQCFLETLSALRAPETRWYRQLADRS